MLLLGYCAWCTGPIAGGWRVWLERLHVVRWTGRTCPRHVAALRAEAGLEPR